MGRIGTLQTLRQDADRDQRDHQQRDGRAGATVATAPPDRDPQQHERHQQHQPEPEEQRVRGRQRRERPRRWDRLGDHLQAAVEAGERGWAGELATGPKLEDRVEQDPLDHGPGPGHHQMDPHRGQPDDAADQQGPPTPPMPPHHPPDDQEDGDAEVGSERQGEAVQTARDQPRPGLIGRSVGGVLMETANHEHRRPQGQAPIHRSTPSPSAPRASARRRRRARPRSSPPAGPRAGPG